MYTRVYIYIYIHDCSGGSHAKRGAAIPLDQVSWPGGQYQKGMGPEDSASHEFIAGPGKHSKIQGWLGAVW